MGINQLTKYVENVRQSGISIYDSIEVGDPNLWIPTPELEEILNLGMKGISLHGLPLRTRAKVVKEHICKTLGYPVPSSFKKTQPRFPGQFFDTYIQKSNNLQIWNEKLSPTRRYVIIKVSDNDYIEKVKVVTGDTLALLDTTGTLTQKYQARITTGANCVELITESDTPNLKYSVNSNTNLAINVSPIDHPKSGEILPITDIFNRLRTLIGTTFLDAGYDQERNRGALLHRLVCERLGYNNYRDDGRFPDIKNQLLEVKLQTSPTIDLGLVCPNSNDALDVPNIGGNQILHCDVRYAIFYAEIDNKNIKLTHLFLTTGEKFFTRFPQFQGRVLNKKLQIPLPYDFFS